MSHKTQRFVTYNGTYGKDPGPFIIHMYPPRFVGKVCDNNGQLRVEVYDIWDSTDESNLHNICKEMKKWFYYQFVKPH